MKWFYEDFVGSI